MADPNLPLVTYPISEPTSSLTFQDLIQEVALKIGCSSYGADGTGAPAIPTDTHDLTLCQRIVNKAIRMFIVDGPAPSGWRWLNVIAQTDLWPQIAYDPTGQTYVTASYNAGPNTTTLTLVTPAVAPEPSTVPPFYVPSFFSSMELRQIWLNGNPPTNTPGWWLPVDEQTPGTAITLASLTSSSTTATATTSSPHGFSNGNSVTIYGASQTPYNGLFTVTVTSATTFTYTMNTTATSPATGAIFAVLGDYRLGTAFTILSYLSPTQILVDGNATNQGFPTNIPIAFAANGDYTLPANFSGQYTGAITYVANTNRGMILSWTDEASIRERRQNYNVESGTPYWAAVRLMPTPSYQILTNASGLMTPRRRWELMTWRISSEFLSVIFPYSLAFNNLVNLTDLSPAPFSHDEAILSACKAVAEKEVEDTYGPDWDYYRNVALVNSKRIDAASAPKRLGYFGNPYSGQWPNIKQFRDSLYQRPTVPVFGQS
jgi:hypothetical protein